MVNEGDVIRSVEELNARWQTSVAAERTGDMGAAEAGYRAILQIAPQHPAALRRLARIGKLHGDLDAAQALLERAVAANNAYGPAQLDLADILQQNGDIERAAGLYQSGIALGDAGPAYISNYAACLLKLQHFEQGLAMCEHHRATGTISANVDAYTAQALWELGQDDAALTLIDPARFAFPRTPAPPPGYNDIAAFNQDLVAALESHPTLTNSWNPTDRAARGGRVTENLFAPGVADIPVISAFRQMIEREVANLSNTLDHTPQTMPDHPFFGRRAKQPYEIVSWANLMPGQGVQASHIHNLGWLSGVYYPKLPAALGASDDDHAGWLGFGRPGYGIPAKRPPKMRFLRPEEGLMVCFPSYIWHWTEPFQGDEERVSIAFDIA